MADFKITLPNAGENADKFKQNMAALADKMNRAISAAMNMAASMIKEQGDADITAAGNFGTDWTNGLHVDVEGSAGNMRISMYHDNPNFGIFENGGVIHGKPLMWIGISGTDAEGMRASEYPGGLFSVNRKSGGVPLLFSIADKSPKFFGTESVTMPKLFHLDQIETSVMANFKSYFQEALSNG